MKKFSISIILLLLALSFTSCVKEKTDACDADLILRFEYTLNPEYRDLFNDHVDELDLFFYNSASEFISHKKMGRNSLRNGNLYYTGLNAGTYTVVVWANLNENHFNCESGYSISEMCLDLNIDPTGHSQLATLFHGISTFYFDGESDKTVDISLIRNTNDIHVQLTGSAITGRIDDFSVSIYGNNGNYLFDNSLAVNRALHYFMPSYHYEENKITANFTVMRLLRSSELMVEIYEDDNLIWEDHLVELIIKAYNYTLTDEDLDRFHNFSLIFTLDRQNDNTVVVTSINVNDWIFIPDTGGI